MSSSPENPQNIAELGPTPESTVHPKIPDEGRVVFGGIRKFIQEIRAGVAAVVADEIEQEIEDTDRRIAAANSVGNDGLTPYHRKKNDARLHRNMRGAVVNSSLELTDRVSPGGFGGGDSEKPPKTSDKIVYSWNAHHTQRRNRGVVDRSGHLASLERYRLQLLADKSSLESRFGIAKQASGKPNEDSRDDAGSEPEKKLTIDPKKVVPRSDSALIFAVQSAIEDSERPIDKTTLSKVLKSLDSADDALVEFTLHRLKSRAIIDGNGKVIKSPDELKDVLLQTRYFDLKPEASKTSTNNVEASQVLAPAEKTQLTTSGTKPPEVKQETRSERAERMKRERRAAKDTNVASHTGDSTKTGGTDSSEEPIKDTGQDRKENPGAEQVDEPIVLTKEQFESLDENIGQLYNKLLDRQKLELEEGEQVSAGDMNVLLEYARRTVIGSWANARFDRTKGDEAGVDYKAFTKGILEAYLNYYGQTDED